MPRAARPRLQLPGSGQACPKQSVRPESSLGARLGLSKNLNPSRLHVHRIVAMADKLADSGRCSRAEHSWVCGVVYRVSAAALSASEPAACTQSRVAQHAQHSSAPDMSSSPPNGKKSSMQPPLPLRDLPSTLAEGSASAQGQPTPAQGQPFPSWLAQQVLPAHSQGICCGPDIP